jgi:hypothetical protein
MTIDAIVAALKLPPESLVKQRIAKKLFLEHGALTASDRKLLIDTVDGIVWEAELKSVSSGIPAYRDAEREYLEIAVLSLVVRAEAADNSKSVSRITDLVHRAIPYPVMLIARVDKDLQLSIAHKRWSLNEEGKTVLEGDPLMVILQNAVWSGDFISSLAFNDQNRSNFHTFYASWESKLKQSKIAAITGFYRHSNDQEKVDLDYADYIQYTSLQKTIAELRAAARGEAQLNKRVEMNLEIATAERASRDIERRLGKPYEE